MGQLGQGILYKDIVSISNSNRGATKIPINNWLVWPQKLHHQKEKQIDTQLSITTDSLMLTKVSRTFLEALTKHVVVGKINEVIHKC